MGTPRKAVLSQGQKVTGAGALGSYAIGYPLALVAHVASGWVLVILGGVFLIAFGVATIRRIQQEP